MKLNTSKQNISKLNSLILGSCLVGGLLISSAQADTLRHAQRHSFQTEVTRTAGDRSLRRTTEQVAGQGHFQRTTQFATGQGKTASRKVQGEYDAAAQTYTRTLESTRPNGDTVSSVRETTKTEDGFVRSQSRTNADGQMASKQVSVSVDHENQVQTRNVEASGYAGASYSASTTRSWGDSGEQ
ncbi:hypothetical protein [Ketobacter sp.]|uniref:hypothetical protein n=1 Tax=Ketobacter sp. TaxID=2083498 RepID=UPI000F22763A|nr:hypothetical protein [Ketobacter sp.]RLU01879.1 MAG: hypothetical protein D9N14_00835 [Ketobacter sp.]